MQRLALILFLQQPQQQYSVLSNNINNIDWIYKVNRENIVRIIVKYLAEFPLDEHFSRGLRVRINAGIYNSRNVFRSTNFIARLNQFK